MSGKKRLQNRFPGLDGCLRMMRKPRGLETSEEGFLWLLSRAGEYITELIGESGSPAAFPLHVEQMHSNDESVRRMAASGLKKINTKEAKRALWKAEDGRI